MRSPFQAVLQPPPAEDVTSLDGFFTRFAEATRGLVHSVDRAAAGGACADRVGYAFVAGYTCALRRLVPDLPGDRAAFCVSEAGGTHPRAMLTKLTMDGQTGALRGEKTFVTLARAAETLLVVASAGGGAEGRNVLRVVRVTPDRPGVTIRERPPFPAAPEIPHGRVALVDVPVSQADVLEGDGYARYVKPFRTLEDTHVLASVLGYVGAVARRHGWPDELVEAILAALAALRTVGDLEPDDPGAQLALAGAFRLAERAFDDAEPHWPSAGAAPHARWSRDRLLLGVASAARAQRRDVAWRSVRDGERPPA